MIKVVYSIFFLSAAAVSAQEKLPISKDYWKSQAFLKEFNGSYRINANIEPVLSGEVRADLVGIQSLMASGSRASALKKLKASKFAKTSPAIIFNIGNIQSEEGDVDEAIESYLAAIKMMPSFRRAHQNVAYCYARKNQLDKAYEHLLEVVRLGGNDGSVSGLLGNCYQQKERFQAALLCFRKAQLTQPEVTDWKLGTAFCLQKLNKNAEALVQYEELEKLMPDSADVKLQLASLMVSLERRNEAVVKLELLSRLGKLDTQNELWLGTLYLAEGNVSIGSETLKRVIKKGVVKNFDSFLNAIRYSADLNLDELARELLALVKQNELKEVDEVRLVRLEAQLDLRQPETEAKGVELLKALIKSDPTDVHSQYLMGSHLVIKGENQEAVVLLEQALLTESKFKLELYLELAKAQVQLKLFKEALQPLKSYLELQDDKHVREYYEAIEKLVKAQNL